MIEEWKNVGGFPGYEVSNLGRVRSYWISAGPQRVMCETSRVLKADVGRATKQYRVTLFRYGARCRFIVGVLVLEAFVGPRPDGLICLHGPSGRHDNSAANLSWGTYSKNAQDRRRDGTETFGEAHLSAKLTDETAREAHRLVASGLTTMDVARRFGVTPQAIGALIRGKTWRHLRLLG